jgi:hypothetical protein
MVSFLALISGMTIKELPDDIECVSGKDGHVPPSKDKKRCRSAGKRIPYRVEPAVGIENERVPHLQTISHITA